MFDRNKNSTPNFTPLFKYSTVRADDLACKWAGRIATSTVWADMALLNSEQLVKLFLYLMMLI